MADTARVRAPAMRKLCLKDLARFGESPVFRWIDEAEGVRRALLLILEGQSFGSERLSSPVSLLVVEGHVAVTSEGSVIELREGDLLDIPPFTEHAIIAHRKTILWLHRYDDSDDR